MINYTAPIATTTVKADLTLNSTPTDASPYTLDAGQSDGVNRLHSITPKLANGDPLGDGLYLFAIEEDNELQPGYYPYKIAGGVEVPVDGIADNDRAALEATRTAAERLTETRALNLDTVARDATKDDYKATGFNIVEPDNTGISLLTALLTVDNASFTTTALQNAPVGGSGGSGLSAGQATQLAQIHNTLSSDGVFAGPAFANLPLIDITGLSTFDPSTSAVTIGAVGADTVTGISDFIADGFATPANVTDTITAAVTGLATDAGLTAAKDAVIDRGNSAWSTAVNFATNEGVWGVGDRSLTDKEGFALSTAAITAVVTAVWTYTGGRLLSGFGNLVDQIWSFGNRGLTEAVETDAASRVASQNDLSFLTPLIVNGAFTADALQFAPTGSGEGGTLTPTQAETFSFLRGLINTDGTAFTGAAFSELATDGGLTVAERERLFELPTDALTFTQYTAPPTLVDIQQAINESESAIIAEGTASWKTAEGFATVNPDNTGILNAIGGVNNAVANIPVVDLSGVLSAIADKPVTPATDLAPVLTAIQSSEAITQALSDRATESRLSQLDIVATTVNKEEFKADIPSNFSTFDPSTDLVSVGKIGSTEVSEPGDLKASGFNTVEPNNAEVIAAKALLEIIESRLTDGRAGALDSISSISDAVALLPGASDAATAVSTALAPKLDAIAADALLSSLKVGDVRIDPTTAQAVFTRNGTVVRRLALTDENGLPNATKVFRQQVI